WSQLRLPNGQTACSAWRETLRRLEDIRISRNVKFQSDDTQHETPSWRFAEVQYYFILTYEATHEAVAMVSLFSTPDRQLLHESSGTILSCMLLGETNLRVIDVKTINSIVAAIPHPRNDHHPELEGNVFILEKPGLDL
ncbi:hypothetical protein BDQ17DRAFT_1194575, partial [Cyathus striatus]